jgi:hypothetical protein
MQACSLTGAIAGVVSNKHKTGQVLARMAPHSLYQRTFAGLAANQHTVSNSP